MLIFEDLMIIKIIYQLGNSLVCCKFFKIVLEKLLYMYVNGKMIPAETIAGMVGAAGIKNNGGGSEFKYDIFDIL
jgi:hypothetical protein